MLALIEKCPPAGRLPEKIEIELTAAEALAGQKQALGRFRKYEKEVDAEKSSPLDWFYVEMLAGTVEEHSGLPDSAEGRLRTALSVAKREGRQQPADSVEIYVRLAQLLTSSGRRQELGRWLARGYRLPNAPAEPFLPRIRWWLTCGLWRRCERDGRKAIPRLRSSLC